ncbi:MAG: hypothetical protein WC527_01300 [Candidatus Margulisiibacteriota bacterium]
MADSIGKINVAATAKVPEQTEPSVRKAPAAAGREKSVQPQGTGDAAQTAADQGVERIQFKIDDVPLAAGAGESIPVNYLPELSPTSNIKLALAYAGWEKTSGYEGIVEKGEIPAGLTTDDIEGVIEVFSQGYYRTEPNFSLSKDEQGALVGAAKVSGLGADDYKVLYSVSNPLFSKISGQWHARLDALSKNEKLSEEARTVLIKVKNSLKIMKPGLSDENIAALKDLVQLIKNDPQKFGSSMYSFEPKEGEGEDVARFNKAMSVLSTVSFQIGVVTDLPPQSRINDPFTRTLGKSYGEGKDMALATSADIPKIKGADNYKLMLFKMTVFKSRTGELLECAQYFQVFETELASMITKHEKDLNEAQKPLGVINKSNKEMMVFLQGKIETASSNAISEDEKKKFNDELERISKDAEIGSQSDIKKAQTTFNALAALAGKIKESAAVRMMKSFSFLTDASIDNSFLDGIKQKHEGSKDFIRDAIGKSALRELGLQAKDITNYTEFVTNILTRDGGKWESLSVTVGEDLQTTRAKRILSAYFLTSQTEQKDLPVMTTILSVMPFLSTLSKIGSGIFQKGDISLGYGPANEGELFTYRSRLFRLKQAVGSIMNSDSENMSIYWYLALLGSEKNPALAVATRFSGQDALSKANSLDARTIGLIIDFLTDTKAKFTETDYRPLVEQMMKEGKMFFDPRQYDEWIPKLEALRDELQKSKGSVSVYTGPDADIKLKGESANTRECCRFLGQVLIDIFSVYGEADLKKDIFYSQMPFQSLDLTRLKFIDKNKTKQHQEVSVVPDRSGKGYEAPFGLLDTITDGVLDRPAGDLAYDVAVGGTWEATKMVGQLAVVAPQISIIFAGMIRETEGYVEDLIACRLDPGNKTKELDLKQKGQALAAKLGQMTGMMGAYSYSLKVWFSDLINIFSKDPKNITDDDISKMVGSFMVFAPFAIGIANRWYGMGRQVGRKAVGLDGLATNWGLYYTPVELMDRLTKWCERTGLGQKLGIRKYIADHMGNVIKEYNSLMKKAGQPVDDFVDVAWEKSVGRMRTAGWTLADYKRDAVDWMHKSLGRAAVIPDSVRFFFGEFLTTKALGQAQGRFYMWVDRVQKRGRNAAADKLKGLDKNEVNKNCVYFYGERILFLDGDGKIIKKDKAQEIMMQVDSIYLGEMEKKARDTLGRLDPVIIDYYLDQYIAKNQALFEKTEKLVKNAGSSMTDSQVTAEARRIWRERLEGEIRQTVADMCLGEATREQRLPLRALEDLKEDFGKGIPAEAKKLQDRIIALSRGKNPDQKEIDAARNEMEALIQKMTGKEYWANVYQKVVSDTQALYGNDPKGQIKAMLELIADLNKQIESFAKMTGRERVLMPFASDKLDLIRDCEAWTRAGVARDEIGRRIQDRAERSVRQKGGSVEDMTVILQREVRKYASLAISDRLASQQHASSVIEFETQKNGDISLSVKQGSLDIDPEVAKFIKESKDALSAAGISRVEYYASAAQEGQETMAVRPGADGKDVLVIFANAFQATPPAENGLEIRHEGKASDPLRNLLSDAIRQRQAEKKQIGPSQPGQAISSMDEMARFMEGKPIDPRTSEAQREMIPTEVENVAKYTLAQVGTITIDQTISIQSEWEKIKTDYSKIAEQRRSAIEAGADPSNVPDVPTALKQRFAVLAWRVANQQFGFNMSQAQLEAIFIPHQSGKIESVAEMGTGYGKSLPEVFRCIYLNLSTGMPVRMTSWADNLVEQLYQDNFKPICESLGIEVGRVSASMRENVAEKKEQYSKQIVLSEESERAFNEIGNLQGHTAETRFGPMRYLLVRDEPHVAQGQNYSVQLLGQNAQALSPVREAIDFVSRQMREGVDFTIKDKRAQLYEPTKAGKEKLDRLSEEQRKIVDTVIKLKYCMDINIDFRVDRENNIYLLLENGVVSPGKVLSGIDHQVLSMLNKIVPGASGEDAFQFDSNMLLNLDALYNRLSTGYTATPGRMHDPRTQIYTLNAPPMGMSTDKGLFFVKDSQTRDSFVVEQIAQNRRAKPDAPVLVFFQNDAEALEFQRRLIEAGQVKAGDSQLISADTLEAELRKRTQQWGDWPEIAHELVKQAKDKGVNICTLMVGTGADFKGTGYGYICLGTDPGLETQLKGRWGGRRTPHDVEYMQLISLEVGTDKKPKDNFMAANAGEAELTFIRQQTEANSGRLLITGTELIDYYHYLQVLGEESFRNNFVASSRHSSMVFNAIFKPFIEFGRGVQEAKTVEEAAWTVIEQVLRNAGLSEKQIEGAKNEYLKKMEATLKKNPQNIIGLKKELMDVYNEQFKLISKRLNELRAQGLLPSEIGHHVGAIMGQASSQLLEGCLKKLSLQEVLGNITVQLEINGQPQTVSLRDVMEGRMHYYRQQRLANTLLVFGQSRAQTVETTAGPIQDVETRRENQVGSLPEVVPEQSVGRQPRRSVDQVSPQQKLRDIRDTLKDACPRYLVDGNVVQLETVLALVNQQRATEILTELERFMAEKPGRIPVVNLTRSRDGSQSIIVRQTRKDETRDLVSAGRIDLKGQSVDDLTEEQCEKIFEDFLRGLAPKGVEGQKAGTKWTMSSFDENGATLTPSFQEVVKGRDGSVSLVINHDNRPVVLFDSSNLEALSRSASSSHELGFELPSRLVLSADPQDAKHFIVTGIEQPNTMLVCEDRQAVYEIGNILTRYQNGLIDFQKLNSELAKYKSKYKIFKMNGGQYERAIEFDPSNIEAVSARDTSGTLPSFNKRVAGKSAHTHIEGPQPSVQDLQAAVRSGAGTDIDVITHFDSSTGGTNLTLILTGNNGSVGTRQIADQSQIAAEASAGTAPQTPAPEIRQAVINKASVQLRSILMKRSPTEADLLKVFGDCGCNESEKAKIRTILGLPSATGAHNGAIVSREAMEELISRSRDMRDTEKGIITKTLDNLDSSRLLPEGIREAMERGDISIKIADKGMIGNTGSDAVYVIDPEGKVTIFLSESVLKKNAFERLMGTVFRDFSEKRFIDRASRTLGHEIVEVKAFICTAIKGDPRFVAAVDSHIIAKQLENFIGAKQLRVSAKAMPKQETAAADATAPVQGQKPAQDAAGASRVVITSTGMMLREAVTGEGQTTYEVMEGKSPSGIMLTPDGKLMHRDSQREVSIFEIGGELFARAQDNSLVLKFDRSLKAADGSAGDWTDATAFRDKLTNETKGFALSAGSFVLIGSLVDNVFKAASGKCTGVVKMDDLGPKMRNTLIKAGYVDGNGNINDKKELSKSGLEKDLGSQGFAKEEIDRALIELEEHQKISAVTVWNDAKSNLEGITVFTGQVKGIEAIRKIGVKSFADVQKMAHGAGDFVFIYGSARNWKTGQDALIGTGDIGGFITGSKLAVLFPPKYRGAMSLALGLAGAKIGGEGVKKLAEKYQALGESAVFAALADVSILNSWANPAEWAARLIPADSVPGQIAQGAAATVLTAGEMKLLERLTGKALPATRIIAPVFIAAYGLEQGKAQDGNMTRGTIGLAKSMAVGGGIGLWTYGMSGGPIGITIAGLAYDAGLGLAIINENAKVYDLVKQAKLTEEEANRKAGLKDALNGWVAPLSGDQMEPFSLEEIGKMYPMMSDLQKKNIQIISGLRFMCPLFETRSRVEDKFGFPLEIKEEGLGNDFNKIDSMFREGLTPAEEERVLDGLIPNWRYLLSKESGQREKFSNRFPTIWKKCNTVSEYITKLDSGLVHPRNIVDEYLKISEQNPAADTTKTVPPNRFWESTAVPRPELTQEDISEITAKALEFSAWQTDFIQKFGSPKTKAFIEKVFANGTSMTQQQMSEAVKDAATNFMTLENMATADTERKNLDKIGFPANIPLQALRNLPNLWSQVREVLSRDGVLRRACFDAGIENLADLEKADEKVFGSVVSLAISRILVNERGQDYKPGEMPVLLTQGDIKKMAEIYRSIKERDQAMSEKTLKRIASNTDDNFRVAVCDLRQHPALLQEVIAVLDKKNALKPALRECGLNMDEDVAKLSDKKLEEVVTLATGWLLAGNNMPVSKKKWHLIEHTEFNIPYIDKSIASVLANPDRIKGYFDTKSVRVVPMITP